MLRIRNIQRGLIGARPVFSTLSPGIPSIFAGKVGILVGKANKTKRTVSIVNGALDTTIAEAAGNFVGGKIVFKSTHPVKTRIGRVHNHLANVDHDTSLNHKNGIGGRNWLTEPGRYDVVIIYHDANRAGKHIDVHIGRVSVIYKVKPDLAAKIKLNSNGYLTEDSRKAIINHVRHEIANGSRVPQNIDHSKSNARATWVNGDTTGLHYGDGLTRQVVLNTHADVYKAHRDGPIEFYAPAINPHRSMYLYRIYPGTDKRAPILIWGNKVAHPPKLEDRLHLKLTHPEEVMRIHDKVDMTTATAKYDGSSCYFVITPKGTTVWSPRTSATTGEQIEYTHKLDGIAGVHSDFTIVGMGEVLFTERKTNNPFKRSGRNDDYLPCATGSGILNSNTVLPETITPEIRIYRIDRFNGRNVSNMNFWENRELQEATASLDPKHLKVVELMDPDTAMNNGFEGFVVVPEGGSVKDGYKVKWWQDPSDWRVDSVEFKPGDKGGVAGIIRCTSLESGKKFKLGPGQVGDQTLTRAMMANPEKYEGVVLKVNSRRGHEGRAAKVVSIHDDKGIGF